MLLLLLAGGPAPAGAALYDGNDEPCLPAMLEPLGLVALCDELRPEVCETLAGFRASGIRVRA